MTGSNQPAAQGNAAATDAAALGSADELLGLFQRERADFLNYKRRVERERAQDREAAQADVIRTLLPLLDELDRALAQVPHDLATHPWTRGIGLTRHRLAGVMSALVVDRIGVEGEPFDPVRHEALFFDTHPDATDQRVSRVIKPGYRLGDRLLRPAQVSVVGPAEPAAAPHTPSGSASDASPEQTRANRATDDRR
jgi:molecular chaperone GrpE